MPSIEPRLTPSIEEKQKIGAAYASIRSFGSWHNEKALDIPHDRVLPFATYSPWLQDAEFVNWYTLIQDYTLVDIYRCYELWTLGCQMSKISGSFLEVGVWRGGTGALLAASLVREPSKRIFLADTFSGVVKAGVEDTAYVGGEHADTSVEIVNQLLSRLKLNNVVLLKGIFPEDTSSMIDGPIALLHCDVDVYSSARDVVNWTLPRLSKGGAIVFDDYGFSGCEGVTRFVNELRMEESLLFLHNLNGHAIFIKK